MDLTPPWVAVTGADGFIGTAFCRHAAAHGMRVGRFVRDRGVRSGGPAQAGVHSDTGPAQPPIRARGVDLAEANVDELIRMLQGASTIVHLAGRAHVIDAADDDAAYRAANVDATERLAQAGVAAGVRRFVFASTVKVNGEATARGRPFQPDDPPAPHDAYARSKLAAERALLRVADGTPMRPLILRLPLVHGPGARGNFGRMVEAVAARRWLPFAAIDNRRSLIGLPNLIDALGAAIDAPPAAVGVHFVADAHSVSTPDLVRAIARAIEVRPRLVPVPVALLRGFGALAGHRDALARLTGSLEVDTASFAAATAWRPAPFAIDPATAAR